MVTSNKRQLRRRQFLQIGGLGLGGLSLPFLTAAKTFGATDRPVTGKSVIFLTSKADRASSKRSIRRWMPRRRFAVLAAR